MKKVMIPAILILILLAQSAGADDSSVLVTTQPLVKKELAETLACYGTVGFDPAGVQSLNFGHAGRIAEISARPGELVDKDRPLVRLITNPQDSAGYAQAKSAMELARGEQERVKRLFDQQLATRSQLAAAEKALVDAEAALKAEQELGAGSESETLVAPFDALVREIHIAPGDRIQAGAPVLELASIDRLQAVLGIEPEDAARVRPGMPVRLEPVFGTGSALFGTIGSVHGLINKDTGLVDVTVGIAPGRAVRGLIPGTRMSGLITIRTRRVFAVPSRAVLTDDRGAYVYVVRNGQARRINVTTTITTPEALGIEGPLKTGERIVTTGNYELTDGAAIRESGK